MRLYTDDAERLYLNISELNRFVAAAHLAPPDICRLALLLTYTGMRVSEACNLRHHALQTETRIVSVRSLKKRHKLITREIPMPLPLARAFEGLRGDPQQYLWGEEGRPLSRVTAYRWIKKLMVEADISGPRACPHGLRHSFGTRAVLAGVPLHLLQKWMGHASMETTAIYATVMGPDQVALADQMWREE